MIHNNDMVGGTASSTHHFFKMLFLTYKNIQTPHVESRNKNFIGEESSLRHLWGIQKNSILKNKEADGGFKYEDKLQ